MRSCVLAVATLLTACAGAGHPQPTAAERYGAHCQGLGHAPGSDAFQACVQTEALNADVTTQREYDRKLLRRLDCVDPRIACDPPR